MKRAEIIAAEALRTSVPEDMAGLRLDVAAARLFPDYSRSKLKEWMESGALMHNRQRVVRVRDFAKPGDELALIVPERDAPRGLHAQALPLAVVYEDRAIAVINKPAGLTVHPGAGTPDGTLQNALLHRFPQVTAVPRAGLVHRLDKDTTGLLVVALTAAAHTRLTAMMMSREVRREYDALVVGILPAGGTVDAAIGRSPHSRTKMAVMDVPERGRRAVTHYRVAEKFVQHTRLTVQLETGRTHQIRVHLAHLRHPIVGDPAYGGRAVRNGGLPAELRDQLTAFRRQALHARELALEHPTTRKTMSWSAPLPDDFDALLRALRAHAKAKIR
ncbi:MAG: 23S rRNA pseudouridine(1911/1915/1917) synthase RluD [Pseudomonadota bacterium]